MKMFPPKHRVKVFAVALLVLGVFGAVFWHVREPSYDGTTLSEWLEQARDFSDLRQEDTEAGRAIRGIGARAVPTLLRMLHQRPSKWKAKANKWIEQLDWPQRFTFFDGTEWARADGLRGFQILGPVAKPAIPSLAGMINDPELGPWAIQALYAIGPETTPLLINALGSTNNDLRTSVAFALSSCQTNAAGVREQMWTLRHDTNDYVAMAAIHWMLNYGPVTQRLEVAIDALRDGRRHSLSASLGNITNVGAEWTNALPEVRRLMNSPDALARVRITNAMKRIDPVLAASIGINTNVPRPSTNRLARPGRGRRGGPSQ